MVSYFVALWHYNVFFVCHLSRSTKLEYGVLLLGAFSDIEITDHLKNAVLDCSGEEVLGWCQIFKRAIIIKGEVFHSKSYGRVFKTK